MDLSKLKSEEKVAYLVKPIIKVLQESGGCLTREEIKDKIIIDDDAIAQYAAIINTSKKTGKDYSMFGFKFNFAIKNLSFVDIVQFERGNPNVSLTEKGQLIDLDSFDVLEEVMKPSWVCWENLSKKNKVQNKTTQEDEIVYEEINPQNHYDDNVREKLLLSISKMSPRKFEQFSRQLLTKMGVQFTEIGTQVSGDGGIDGFGYHLDPDDFRTSKVVIQCKRYNEAPVSEPIINSFLGAMSKFQADYGIIITNSTFTKAARTAAMQGQPITLIDGDKLVDLILRYELGVQRVTSYELLGLYNEE